MIKQYNINGQKFNYYLCDSLSYNDGFCYQCRKNVVVEGSDELGFKVREDISKKDLLAMIAQAKAYNVSVTELTLENKLFLSQGRKTREYKPQKVATAYLVRPKYEEEYRWDHIDVIWDPKQWLFFDQNWDVIFEQIHAIPRANRAETLRKEITDRFGDSDGEYDIVFHDVPEWGIYFQKGE